MKINAVVNRVHFKQSVSEVKTTSLTNINKPEQQSNAVEKSNNNKYWTAAGVVAAAAIATVIIVKNRGKGAKQKISEVVNEKSNELINEEAPKFKEYIIERFLKDADGNVIKKLKLTRKSKEQSVLEIFDKDEKIIKWREKNVKHAVNSSNGKKYIDVVQTDRVSSPLLPDGLSISNNKVSRYYDKDGNLKAFYKRSNGINTFDYALNNGALKIKDNGIVATDGDIFRFNDVYKDKRVSKTLMKDGGSNSDELIKFYTYNEKGTSPVLRTGSSSLEKILNEIDIKVNNLNGKTKNTLKTHLTRELDYYSNQNDVIKTIYEYIPAKIDGKESEKLYRAINLSPEGKISAVINFNLNQPKQRVMNIEKNNLKIKLVRTLDENEKLNSVEFRDDKGQLIRRRYLDKATGKFTKEERQYNNGLTILDRTLYDNGKPKRDFYNNLDSGTKYFKDFDMDGNIVNQGNL